MKLLFKIFICCLVVVLVSVSFFYLGGFYCFSKGYTYAKVFNAPADASISVALLKRLRNQRIEASINLLESQLDNQILTHWYGSNSCKSSFNSCFRGKLDAFDSEAMELMKIVAQYRKVYKTNNDDLDMQDSINDAVNYYIDK